MSGDTLGLLVPVLFIIIGAQLKQAAGRGSHSFTFQLNLSRVRHTQNTLHTLSTP